LKKNNIVLPFHNGLLIKLI